MSEHANDNVEQVVGSAVSVPMNLIALITDLLISKGVMSRQEMASAVRSLAEISSTHGENEVMVRMLLEGFAARFEDQQREHNH
jgi:hypothetical protein